MKTRAAFTVLAALGSATSAFAQVQNTECKVRYVLSYDIAHQGSNGWVDGAIGDTGTLGSVDANEAVLFTVTAQMLRVSNSALAPVNNSANNTGGLALHWQPTILAGSSGTGTLAGFWNGDFNLAGGAGSGGAWSDTSAAYAGELQRYLATWQDSGATGTGTPALGGSLMTDVQPAQFGANSRLLDHSNDAPAWQGLWIPAAGPNRTVHWAIAPGSLGLLSSVAARDSTATNTGGGLLTPIAMNVNTEFGDGVGLDIPVLAPAPSSLALLGLGGIVVARRRRR